MKSAVHKIKWQVLEGFFIRSYSQALCCNLRATQNRNGSVRWQGVTCKNCLKMKKQ
jgi:hypothetical protein